MSREMIRKNLCVVDKETEHQAGPDNPQVCWLAGGRDKTKQKLCRIKLPSSILFDFLVCTVFFPDRALCSFALPLFFFPF